MKVTAQFWGNSLGFRIPATIAREVRLEAGTELNLEIENGRIVLTPLKHDLESMLAKVTPENIPGEVWGAPVGKELW